MYVALELQLDKAIAYFQHERNLVDLPSFRERPHRFKEGQA
jgi:hypothetical protein